MNEYLELVRSTSNILPANLVVLKREYGAIAEYFAERLKSNRLVESEVTDRVEPADVERPKESDAMPVKPLPVKKDIHPISGGSSQLSDRQNTIIEFIRKNGRAKISDFVASLANVSSKTIQRDLQDLVSRDVLKKEGEKRWTTYSMNI